MRRSIPAIIVIAASVTAFQATAQQAAPSNQTGSQIHSDADRQLKTTGPGEQMQREADKGVKTRNSGESGFVGDQEKDGASAHAPGQPGSEQTTGSSPSSQTSGPKEIP